MGRVKSKSVWHLWNRKDSPYWWVWRYDSKDPKKRIRRPTTKRKADYTKEQMQKIINTVQGIVRDYKAIDYSIDWFEDYIMRKLKLEDRSKSLQDEYKAAINYLRLIYGDHYSILNIGREAIDRIKEKMLECGRKRKTINNYLTVFRAAFERLLIDEKIDKNPFYRFPRMKIDNTEKKHLKLSELKDFLDFVKQNIDENTWRIIRIYAGTGRRRNEILFLKHDDVDLIKGIYRPRNIKSHDKHRITRSIPDDVIEDFAYFINKNRNATYPFKFCYEDTLTRKVTALFKKAGYPTLTLHSLRHTYLTILREKGIAIRDAQLIIDHSRISTTEGYLHESVMDSPNIGI